MHGSARSWVSRNDLGKETYYLAALITNSLNLWGPSLIFNQGSFPENTFVAQDVLSDKSARMEHIESLTMPPPPTCL
jgi:hypothetical protein